MGILDVLSNYFASSGFGQLQWPNLVMIAIGMLFIFLAVRKGFEPLLLVPIGFGILIGNIPYDSSQLPLSVYDGPVSEHDLKYYRVRIASVTLPSGETVSLQQAWDQLQLDRHGDQAKADPIEPWNYEKFQLVMNAADAVQLADVQPIDSHMDGARLLEDGQALMINNHAVFSAGRLPQDFTVPGIYNLGQGRSVFVLSPNDQNRYPQVWSPQKQEPYNASVFYWLFAGVGFGFFPPLIFLGVGAMTDFGPMLANPKTLLLGAAAQFGIFGALLGAVFLGFDLKQAASIGIIGGADGPTAIFTCTQLAPELLGAVALAAYSYMAMVPIIQPPIMKLLTTKKERLIRMEQIKPVSRKTKIIFPVVGFLVTTFIANGALPLLGMLFFGNLLRESLVTDRLAKTAQSAFIDIVTILLGVTVGAKTSAANFLTLQTIYIFALGVVAFGIATATGVLFAKIMNALSAHKINPLIGAAGVSAVPMAARVAHRVGQEEDPQNFLLMHAMGPNVAGVIGSAVAAGVLLSKLAGT
jgi:oxaloacetate decarboxylase beta subunit